MTGAHMTRLTRVRKREGASLPVPPSHTGLPGGDAATLNEIKERIRTEHRGCDGWMGGPACRQPGSPGNSFPRIGQLCDH